MTPEEVIALADPDAVVWDGFNDAIIGLDIRGRIVYDKEIMINILMEDDDMEEIDAIEHLEYNVFGSYVGDMTPIHIELLR